MSVLLAMLIGNFRLRPETPWTKECASTRRDK
jgi:hypothetical protein